MNMHHKQLELEFLEELDYSNYEVDVQYEFDYDDYPSISLEEFESNLINFDKYGVEVSSNVLWEPFEDTSSEKIKILENEVFTLQGQLQTAYKRIAELNQELDTFKSMVKPNSRTF
jgi:hypothetical protein